MNKDAGMNKDVCAVILAGGKSSRMGRDKASLTLGNETFLQRIAAELDACGFQEKYVSLGSGSRYGMPEKENGTEAAEKTEIRIPGGWTAVRDRYRNCGPLGGIHAALSACRAEWSLFVSCDTPLYRRELAELLISKVPGLSEVSGTSEIPGTSEVTAMSKKPPSETDPEKREPSVTAQLVIPVTPDGRWHMTCAIWRRTLLPEVEAQLISGDHRLRALCFKNGEPSPGTVLVRLEGEQAAFAEMLENINTEEDYRQMVVKNCRGS